MHAMFSDRQLVPRAMHNRIRTRIILRVANAIAALAILIAIGEQSWAQSAKEYTTLANSAAEHASADVSQSPPNTVRFIAKNTPIAKPETRSTAAAAPVVSKPSDSPPLAVADYKHFISRRAAIPPANTDTERSLPVLPNHSAEAINPPVGDSPANATSQSSVEAAALDQVLVDSLVAKSPRAKQSVVVVKSVSISSPPPSPRIAAPPTTSIVDTNLTQAADLETRVALVEHAPTKPTPTVAPHETLPANVETLPTATADTAIVPMTTSNYLGANPENYCFRCGVKCPPCGCNPGGPGWAAARPIPWEVFAQGEYVGPARLAHVPVYRLRVDDQLAFVYRLSGAVSGQPYRLNVRDRIQVQSVSAPEVVNRELTIEPDGTITLPLLGQVRAAGATVEELTKSLDDQFKRHYKDPRISVTPLDMNSNLQEMRSSVDRRYGQGGQVSDARISPDGTVQLPAIGSVPAQGLTLDELEREIKARYGQIVEGLEVTPILTNRAPRYIYVVGEVHVPGRYSMEGPTTLMQAITLAGSWNVGAQLNEVIVFRRDENWQLMATKVNIRESLLFRKPCPSGEIWLRDSDVVLVPKSPILCADDLINLVFTRGIYGVFPMSATLNFAKLSSL